MDLNQFDYHPSVLFLELSSKSRLSLNAVGDLGFRKGDTNPKRGCQSIIWPLFCRKLHENEENWVQIEGAY